MPVYTVERQYLVPAFQHITLEAESPEAAMRAAMDESRFPWGDNTTTDYEGARAHHISGAWEGEDAYQGEAFAVPADLAGEA